MGTFLFLAIDDKLGARLIDSEYVFMTEEGYFRGSSMSDSSISLPKRWVNKLLGHEPEKPYLGKINRQDGSIEEIKNYLTDNDI